ncbi:hypothetical protein DY000_02012338 [Brassica cretica]|uniref:Uncharacterized protein n=1 Tax=Brassica cretica TaxID=69181 RepID=A0ABQ7CXM0_BRACR|nr:hypothetical protein DY000_02012338 [Brassica cretica]
MNFWEKTDEDGIVPPPTEDTYASILRNKEGILLGIEMLMIDAEGTLAQWFIGQNRRNKYEKELQRGRIYTLTNFYASNSKVMYHVADQRLVICISHASALSKDEEDIEGILTERFRVHSFLDFEANCDLRGDLHDVVGHLKLVDGQALHQHPVLCTKDDSASQKVMVHLQLKDGPVINVYLWDEAAVSFRLKFDASEATPTVLLVTTVNPKSLGGKLCLSSMSSSRVFLDEDVDPTREYLTWLTTNPSATSLVNPVEGTLAQGFIGQNRRNQYEKELQRGRIYTLTNFYASNNKVMYHVADQRLVICISHASALSKDEEDIEGILTERFRVHSFSDFEANCDLRGDLHGKALHHRPVLCTKDDSASRKVMVHLQLKDGPVINFYLWDEAAVSFRLKFDASEATPTVLLVTTVNPKSLGGKLCLSSMSSSRVFLDEDVDPTREYLTWLTTNPSATSLVNPVEVVKAETLTIIYLLVAARSLGDADGEVSLWGSGDRLGGYQAPCQREVARVLR